MIKVRNKFKKQESKKKKNKENIIKKLNPGIFMNQEKEYKPQGTIESLSVNNDKFHIERFEELYKENHIDVKELRKLAWIGLPRSKKNII